MAYQVKRYRMDLDGKSISAAGVFLGAALFFRVVYYFGFDHFFGAGIGEILLKLIFPGVLELAAIVLLRGVRLNAPGVYGILGALECILLIIDSFGHGSVLRVVLAVAAYLICGGLIFATSAGWLSKEIAVCAVALTVIVRLLAFDIPAMMETFQPVAMLPDLAWLCVVLGLGFLSFGFKLVRKEA